MKAVLVVVVAAILAAICGQSASIAQGVFADDGDGANVVANPKNPSLNAVANDTVPGSADASSPPSDSPAPGSSTPVDVDDAPTPKYMWRPACSENSLPGDAVSCGAAQTCPVGQLKWTLWEQPPGRSWVPVNTVCYAGQPPPPPADGSPPVTRRPQVTPAVVLREVRTIGLPTRRIQVQPADTTLVNLETIFYTTEPVFNHTTRLLGYDIDIIAHPARYTWHTGDGETLTTTTPGAPYPQGSIVHRYHHRATNLHPRLHITYQIRFRVNDRNWQTIDQTLTTQGPPTTLTIKEATPLLTS
ncbi:MAG: hypothetical protein H0V59_01970 [Nocardioidaceae bacterium]|nr:hypothetical protein [Nocardioidaceae bacterium]